MKLKHLPLQCFAEHNSIGRCFIDRGLVINITKGCVEHDYPLVNWQHIEKSIPAEHVSINQFVRDEFGVYRLNGHDVSGYVIPFPLAHYLSLGRGVYDLGCGPVLYLNGEYREARTGAVVTGGVPVCEDPWLATLLAESERPWEGRLDARTKSV